MNSCRGTIRPKAGAYILLGECRLKFAMNNPAAVSGAHEGITHETLWADLFGIGALRLSRRPGAGAYNPRDFRVFQSHYASLLDVFNSTDYSVSRKEISLSEE
jgi:hypothetical protein